MVSPDHAHQSGMLVGYEPEQISPTYAEDYKSSDFRRFTHVNDATDCARIVASGFRFPKICMRETKSGCVAMDDAPLVSRP